ncbi:hypothetical protein SAMN02744040_01493 [Tepidibacter thalassicus DSM 15285]|uniref:Uncharacterized protein n=1 Tax=Tepidibacter thalassicus DSM 15285 TaxID=1123350 RepID=A0A1M5RS99_9FIRM|nr:hypothetical protein SAMN02744040_01493 [Tepidibacter thalassicus DSM 15285]
MKVKNILIVFLFFIILSMQFGLEIIITSDIPIKVSNSDIFVLSLLSLFQFLFVIKFVKDKHVLNKILLVLGVFFILDFIKIYNIFNLEIKKTYIPIAIEIISIFSSILLCIFRKK